MGKRVEVVCLWLMGMALGGAYATDPNPLQDFCVAVNSSSHEYDGLFVNGLFCKNPKDANPEDFLYRGLDVPLNVLDRLGINSSIVTAAYLPGLNTLGISIGRIDYAPYGVVPPHTHPRATEVITVLEGTLFVGFVTSVDRPNNNGNKLFTQDLKKGDVFVFPQGLVHFQYNIGPLPAAVIIAFSSQNPGHLTIADSVFGSNPPIPVNLLSKSFDVDPSVIQQLQSQYAN